MHLRTRSSASSLQPISEDELVAVIGGRVHYVSLPLGIMTHPPDKIELRRTQNRLALLLPRIQFYLSHDLAGISTSCQNLATDEWIYPAKCSCKARPSKQCEQLTFSCPKISKASESASDRAERIDTNTSGGGRQAKFPGSHIDPPGANKTSQDPILFHIYPLFLAQNRRFAFLISR
jgi:hypothetical protein